MRHVVFCTSSSRTIRKAVYNYVPLFGVFYRELEESGHTLKLVCNRSFSREEIFHV